jgi:predicted secreted protein
MAKNLGYDVLLKLATEVVDGTVTKSIDFTTDMIDVTTDQSIGHAKEYLPGETGASIQCEGKVEEGTTGYSIADLIDAHINRTSLAFIYGKTTAGSMTVTGSGYISALNLGASKGDAQTWSATIQVTGQVTRSTVSS